jgi:hypothetical protein
MHVVALLAKTYENGHYPTHIVELKTGSFVTPAQAGVQFI